MKILSLIFILFSLLLTPTIVFSTIVYENTQTYLGTFSITNLVGDEVTLAGTERLVTEFSFGYWNLNTEGTQSVRVQFYKNDGLSGRPDTLLEDLGSYKLAYGVNDLLITGLSIPIPGDTFTWAVQWEDITTGEAYPLLRFFDPPSIGSSENYLWRFYEGSWDKLPGDPNLKAQIKAEPVPEPSIIPLLIISMMSLVGLRRWWKD